MTKISPLTSVADVASAAMFISLHGTATRIWSSGGAEIYTDLDIDNAASAAATAAVGDTLMKLDTPVLKEGKPWMFLKSPTARTVLIEAGFLAHPVERRLLTSAAYHLELAAAMADGVDAALR